ncbi:hypothetical protein HNQ91_004696 [Filimonas zeae]|uniref:Uncharacterized protein n=1 Tax=Filimonas zeae TaxID=1737353 RepID=A0A917J0V2_9BACT|nr:hypothetical protein [Filimonas zeae]MDR6341623.1 hypothetical protein [Filimonas zeae]GGH74951.1 hypothetical protein GCM10011379_38050 [Filimonas zeae]
MKKFPGFFPRKEADKVLWFRNYALKLEQLGTVGSKGAEEIQYQINLARKVANVIEETNTVKNEYRSKVEEKDALIVAAEKEIGIMALYIKKVWGENEGLAHSLGIVGGSQQMDKNELRPEITVELANKAVRIMFKKQYTHGIAVYGRLRGEYDWTFLGNEVTSPFWDKRPLQKEFVAEMREYQARCTINMQEVGHFSSIASVVVG